MPIKKQFKILENEYFYGGAIEDGLYMPYKNGFKRDLRVDFCSNQASPTLLSSKGRIIKGTLPFYFEIADNQLIVESDEELNIEKVGDNFADAYKYFKDHYFAKYNTRLDDLMLSAPQYDTWMAMGYEPTEEKVIEYAMSILKNGYKPGVLILDDSWALDYGVFEFNKNFFPHPAETIEKLHQLGFKVMLWETPFISPDSANFRYLSAIGLLLKNDKGEEILSKWWNGYSAVLDLSIAEARNWLDGQNKKMMELYNVDGFKLDAADPEYYPDECVFNDNSHKGFQAKYYAEIGLNYSFNELRACFQLEGAPLSQRMKDKYHSWTHEGVERLTQTAIAMSLMGYFYYAPDMVGGGRICDVESGKLNCDEELFIRYAEIAIFLPMIQFSLAPWQCLSIENQKIINDLLKIREEITPTILSLKKEAEENRNPIVRPLFLEYPNDGYENVMDEFLLGKDILVAPIFTKGTTSRKVIIPEGEWVSSDNVTYKKGTYDISSIPGKPIYLKRK